MKPHGIQGFKSAEEARASAREHCPELEFAIMRKKGNYGWLLPVEHAKRVAEGSGVELVEITR